MTNYLTDKEVADKLEKLSEQLDQVIDEFDRIHTKAGYQDAIGAIGDSLSETQSTITRTMEVYQEAAEAK